MRKIWIGAGRLCFWLTWPLLFVNLYFSHRTRVLLLADEDVLVVKGWLGSGKWTLPGGGLHFREKPLKGALREVREETGIVLSADQLKAGYAGRAKSDGHRFTVHAFVVRLDQKPQLAKQKLELVDARWLPWRSLVNNQQAAADTRALLAKWSKL